MQQSSASPAVWKFQMRRVSTVSLRLWSASRGSQRLCELISRRHGARVCRSDVWLSQSDNWTGLSLIRSVGMFRFTGRHRRTHVESNHTDLNIVTCTITPPLDPQCCMNWYTGAAAWFRVNKQRAVNTQCHYLQVLLNVVECWKTTFANGWAGELFCWHMHCWCSIHYWPVLGRLLQARNVLFITSCSHFKVICCITILLSLNCKALHYYCITFKLEAQMQ